MQYKIGTCSVNEGSTQVTFQLTNLLTNASVGDMFKVSGEKVIYQIAAVVSDTQIEIVPAYAGSSKTNVAYQISRDRTPNLGLAEINSGDEDWPYWLTQEVIRKLDNLHSLRLQDMADIHVGPTPPTDPTKTFWIKIS